MSILEVTVVCSPKLFTKDSYACIIYGHTKAFTRICTAGGEQKFEFPLIDGFREFDIAVCSHEDGLIGRAKVRLGKDISEGYNDFWCSVHSQAGELAGVVRLITHLDESFGQESRKGNCQELVSVISHPSFSQHIPQLLQTFKDWKLKPPTSFKCAHCSSTALIGPNCCDTCGHKWETGKEDLFDVIDMGMMSNSGLLASVLNHNRSMSLQCLCGLINKDGVPVNLVGMEYDDSGGGQAADHQACKQADENGKKYEDDSLKQKMGVRTLPQNKEEVRIDMSNENTAEQVEILRNHVKQLLEDKNVLSTMVFASSAQGVASLISAGPSAVPWIITAANAVAFTASLTSICLGRKKPPVSILLSKFGTAALVTVVMGVTYMYLPYDLKWLAGIGCAISIAAVIYT